MPGIGDTLRAERQRQGRTLADAAAETRVRESYLAALEDEDFGVLGGDVYVRGFIRLYGRYLRLDADALVAAFRRDHEKPEEVTAIPGAMVDRVMAPSGPRLPPQPVLAAIGVVAVLVLLFIGLRGGEDPATEEVDVNAPGPSPAAAQEQAAGEGTEAAAPTAPTAGASEPLAGVPADPAVVAGATPGVGAALTEVTIVVTAVQPVTLTVERGTPPVSGATLAPGDSRTLTDPAGQQVVFTVSDFSAAEITVNGGPLINADLAGTPVQISCTVGEAACNATPL